MARDDRERTEARTDKNARNGERKQPRHEADHRLRGEEFADDFVDAESDSCTVTRRRDEKESES